MAEKDTKKDAKDTTQDTKAGDKQQDIAFDEDAFEEFENEGGSWWRHGSSGRVEAA